MELACRGPVRDAANQKTKTTNICGCARSEKVSQACLTLAIDEKQMHWREGTH